MSQHALDLKASVRILRRHKWIVVLAAVLGFLAGVAFTLLDPPMLTSKAFVALPPLPVRDIQTQAVVAGSAPVLASAAQHADPPVSLAALRGRVQVTGVTPDVLEIDVRAGTATQAVATANAVATSYISYIRSPGIPDAWVLEPATSAATTPLPVRLLVDGVLCALLGLLAGAIAVLAVGRNDRRLRGRDEIADATGIPVLASVDASRPTDVAEWRKLIEGYKPKPGDAWNLRKAVHQLDITGARGHGGTSVAVVSLSSDQRALALGPQLAAFAASQGTPVALVIDPGYEAKAVIALRAACAGTSAVLAGRSGDSPIADKDQEIAEPDGQQRTALTVVVAVVDSKAPRVADTVPTTLTVLGVSAGEATAEQLARVAVSAADDGRDVAGIIIADPDPADQTTGRVPQPARSAQRRPPTRVIGMATEASR